MDKFAYFINQFPDRIIQKVEKHLFNDIALFKPQTFIKGEMHAVGFHIIVPSDPPRTTYINGKLQSFEVSNFHFIRTFKQKVGVPPHRYLLSIRIKKAKEMLVLRQHSIAEVATLCGFVSLSHFSSTFRGITGHSPSEYKKLYFQIY